MSSRLDSITKIQAKCVIVSLFICPHSTINIRSNINTINYDILANLGSDWPAAGCLTNFNEFLVFRERSTITGGNVLSKLTSNEAEYFDCNIVYVLVKKTNSCHDFIEECLKIADAIEWKVKLSHDSFYVTIGELYNIIH